MKKLTSLICQLRLVTGIFCIFILSNFSHAQCNFSIVPTIGNVTCYGSSTGYVSIQTIFPGWPQPVSISWSNGSTGNTISNLASGYYCVTVTDNSGCRQTACYFVATNPPINIQSTITPPTCNVSGTGSIALNVSGGTSPYFYYWSNVQTTKDIAGLSAGNYTVTVTDINACTATKTHQISQPASISLSATATNVSCNGGNNGAIDLTVNGSGAPFAYQWSNGQTTQDINQLTAGTYKVTVTTASGCTQSLSKAVSQPTPLIASINYFGNNICANASGGTPGYSYIWTPPGFSIPSYSQCITPGVSGNYSLIILDSKGCAASSNIWITIPGTDGMTDERLDNHAVGNTFNPKIEIWPNPCHEILNVTTSGTTEIAVKFNLYTSTGKLVSTSQTTATEDSSIQFDVSSVPPGMYLLEISTEFGIIETKKLIIR